MRLLPFPGRAALLLCAALWAAPGAALGDVTVERFHRSGGIQGIGASESAVVEKLSGLRKRETRWIRPTGALGTVIGKLAGDIVADEITDIPGDAVRKLDHGKKSYKESPIPRPKAGEAPGRAGEEGRRKPGIRLIRNEVTVRGTGERKRINGFDCRRYIVTWVIETENAATKERSRTTMLNDLWTAPDTKETRSLRKQELSFLKAYLEKAGLDVSDREAETTGLAALSGMFGEDEEAVRGKLGELRKELAAIKGYPIVNGIRWVSETTARGRPAAGRTERKAGKEEATGESAGIGEVVGDMASKAIEKKAEKSAPGDGKRRAVLFASYSEIRKIDLSPIPASEFDAPRGYKREE